MKAVLVTGATGAQGGAVVDAVLSAGGSVRALVRDPRSPAALALEERGVELREGSYERPESVRDAVTGVDAVFSVQVPPRAATPGSELQAASTLVESAVDAGVTMLVHTSVARAGDHESFVGWADGRWGRTYWTSKAAANHVVRTSGLSRWTILKPAFMMDNFMPPKADYLFPQLRDGVILSAMEPTDSLDLIAACDIGSVAVEALTEPDRFNRSEIDLASEMLTMSDIASTLSRTTGRHVSARHLDATELVTAGTAPGVVENQRWASAEGYRATNAEATPFDTRLHSFAEWSRARAAQFRVSRTEVSDSDPTPARRSNPLTEKEPTP